MFTFLRSTSVILPTPATCSVEVMVQLSQIVLGTSVLVKLAWPQTVAVAVGVFEKGGGVKVRVAVGGVPVTVGVGEPRGVVASYIWFQLAPRGLVSV